MPLLLALIFGAAVVLFARRPAALPTGANAAVGGEPVYRPAAPPVGYAGDWVVALPQRKWGKVQHVRFVPTNVAGTTGSYYYVVGFSNGFATVLRDHEVCR